MPVSLGRLILILSGTKLVTLKSFAEFEAWKEKEEEAMTSYMTEESEIIHSK